MLTLLAQIEFEHPLRLLLLFVLLPLLAYFAYRSAVDHSAVRRLACFACRAVAVVALVAALAGIFYREQSHRLGVVFVTDASHSVDGDPSAKTFIEESLASQGDHVARFVTFAAEVGEVKDRPDLDPADLDRDGSDPEAALAEASACIPGDLIPKVILLTDGVTTRGDLGRAAFAAGETPISVVPLTAFAGPEVCLTELRGPQQVTVFDTVLLQVTVASNTAGSGSLRVLRDGSEVLRRAVELAEGENVFELQTEFQGGDACVFAVEITAADTHKENNRRQIKVFAAKPLRILVAAPQPDRVESLVGLLHQQGFQAECRNAAELPVDAGVLNRYDLVVLSDVVASSLSASQCQALDDYVQRLGGGLIAAGGEASFAEATYRGSMLEALLPVAATAAVQQQRRSLALALVIDRSTSMEDENRMELAKEAAKQSIRILDKQDKVGIIAFSNAPVWVSEMVLCTDKEELIRRIDTLEPYGQTRMYQAVQRAFLALEQTDADRRYMILLTDGVPAPGDYLEIAREMAQAGITVSTVSIGQGAEQDLLKEMARIAGGNHRHCDDPEDVPSILAQETREAVGQEAPKQFTPYVLRRLPGLAVESAPPLLGYAPASPKPDAEVLLLAARGDPLLCWWPYGRGITAALTIDVRGQWTRAWQSWPGYGDFWKRLVRHTARRPLPPALGVTLHRRGAVGRVRADLGTGESLEEIRVTGPQGKVPVETIQTAPDRVEATFPAAILGEYSVAVRASSDAIWRGSLFVDYPDELRLQPTRETVLKSVAAVTGGQYAPEPADVFAPDARTRPHLRPLWRWFAILALALLVIDVGIRRLRF